MTIRDIFTIQMSFANNKLSKHSRENRGRRSCVFEDRLCVWSARDTLGEGAAHIGRAAHRADCHGVKLHHRSASKRRNALGLCAVHRASKQIFTTASPNFKSTQFSNDPSKFVMLWLLILAGVWCGLKVKYKNLNAKMINPLICQKLLLEFLFEF